MVDPTSRGGVRSTRGLGLTMTARGQSIGISIGILPQTLIMSRLNQLSRLGTRIKFFHYSYNCFLFVDNFRPEARGPPQERGLGRSPHLPPSNTAFAYQ
jgi:hypothetical protein